MSPRPLPDRPDLDQLKRQARELRAAHRGRSPSAAARIIAHHPDRSGMSARAVLDAPFRLADAQLAIAREYGFPSWARLKHHVETSDRIAAFRPHPRYGDALAALLAGDTGRLRALVTDDPSLLEARTHLDPPWHYFTGATLLHHVAGNPDDHSLPANIVEVGRVLLEAGADANAGTLGRNGGTTMGLLLTSRQASDLDVSGPLIDLLLAHGARLDIHRPDALDGCLANHAPRAAEKLIELGAKPDLFAAAALGRMDLLRTLFDDQGHLRERPRRKGRFMSERDAIGLAFLYAYVRTQHDAMEYLLAKDGNWDMTGVNNGTALHRAAWDGDVEMVARLVRLGADIHNRDNPFRSTPMSWAQHNRQRRVFDWLRAHCAIDLHDAVSFDLPEHIEARLCEDPTSVNHRIDHWEVAQSTPMHWACWPGYDDVEGEYEHDPVRRAALVERLLDAGGDPDIVAGNGATALDFADAGGAAGLVALLERRGAHRARDLP